MSAEAHDERALELAARLAARPCHRPGCEHAFRVHRRGKRCAVVGCDCSYFERFPVMTHTLGTPARWTVTVDGARVGRVECPDEHTAGILAVFRFGAKAEVAPEVKR